MIHRWVIGACLGLLLFSCLVHYYRVRHRQGDPWINVFWYALSAAGCMLVSYATPLT